MRGVLKGFLYLIYIVIVGGLITAIVLTFHHNHVSAPAPAKSGQTVASNESSSSSSSNESTSSSSSSSQSTPKTNTAPSTSSGASSSTGSSSSQNLSNTGPGDTVGLFVGASLLAAFIKRRKLIRHHS